MGEISGHNGPLVYEYFSNKNNHNNSNNQNNMNTVVQVVTTCSKGPFRVECFSLGGPCWSYLNSTCIRTLSRVL